MIRDKWTWEPLRQHSIGRIDLPHNTPLTQFVSYHTCEVYDAGGVFHSRYSTMLCAAYTLLFIGGTEVRDQTPGALDAIWTRSRCVREVNKLKREDWSDIRI